MPIPYWMEGAADVAETTCTPFQGPPVRLIVRRVKPTPGSQLALFATYSYHAFITDRDGETLELEADHRRHAEVENAIRDLKYGVGLNHLPSGRWAARIGSGRADGGHQDPPAPLLLPRRTAHPFGTPPHPASPPTLALGNPSSVAPWPGCKPFRTRLDYAVDNRTAPPDNRRSPQSRASPARDCFLLHADPPISPRRPHRGPPSAPCTATADRHPPHLLESSPDRRVPMSLTPCSNAMAASHRWIRAYEALHSSDKLFQAVVDKDVDLSLGCAMVPLQLAVGLGMER